MGHCVATIVIEPRSLVREALVSLMTSHSYRVAGSVASTSEIEDSFVVAEAPGVVILGPLPSDEAASAAGGIRKLWPKAKIISLFDRASAVDFQTLLASEIDGCIPLFASSNTLIDTLHQIISADVRILVHKTDACSPMSRPTTGQEGDELDPAPIDLCPNDLTSGGDGENDANEPTSSPRIPHGLSEREEEILKSVIRGLPNKMIARTCGITDATIKVHMKSILRKIRVANRTQAAIWALEQGYCADTDCHTPVLRRLRGLAAT